MTSCEDCKKPYQDFGIDTTLRNDQWLVIHPEGKEGILCANCIVKRASSLPGIIAARVTLEICQDAGERTMPSLEKAAYTVGREHMTDLEKVEDIRREVLRTIAIITGVPIGNIEIDIGFHQQNEGGDLFLEARKLDWLPNEYNGSTWIASDERGGSTVVYKDEEEGKGNGSTNEH